MYACIYTHMCAACVKIQILTFSHNAFHSTARGVKQKENMFPNSQYTWRTLLLQLCHYFSPLLLCDGSPDFATLSGNFHKDVHYCPFFCNWGLQTLLPGSAELNQPTGSPMLPNMALPPNSSFPQMCARASSPSWVLALVEPSHELVSSVQQNKTFGAF